MSYEPFKYLLQPVAISRDPDTGRVIAEMPGEVLSVFSPEQAAEAIVEFEHQLAELTNGRHEMSPGNRGGGGKGKPTGATIVLDQTDVKFTDMITFTYDTGSYDGHVWVKVVAVQNGDTVLSNSFPQSIDFLPVPTGTTPEFPLGPTGKWTSGPASCTAALVDKDMRTLAETSFDAAG